MTMIPLAVCLRTARPRIQVSGAQSATPGHLPVVFPKGTVSFSLLETHTAVPLNKNQTSCKER